MQGFVKLWERILKDSQDFGRGFARIHETLEEDSQGFVRLWERIYKDSRDFGRGFARLWTRICETLEKGFARIC